MNKLLLAASAGALSLSSAASAAVYVGSHSVGAGTLQLSITTDDTIGVLSAGNITDWTFTITNGGGTATLNAGNSSNTYFSGTALSATASDLRFNFGGIGHIQWDNFGTSGNDALCLDTPGAAFTCIGGAPRMVVVANGVLDSSSIQGSYVLGSLAAGVPEPSTWAMLILGFLGVGSAMRRSRQARTALVAA